MAKNPELLVGLDIGTSKVAAVVAEVTDGSVTVHGVGSAPTEGLRRGVVVNIDATVHSIESAIREAEVTAGCEIHTVITDVSGSHIRGFNSHGVVKLRNQEVDRADVDRVLNAARVLALPADRDILHVLPQGFVLDDQDGIPWPVGMSGSQLEAHAHVITTASAAVNNVVKCCQRAGLHVADLVLEALAVAEAVVTPAEKELAVAMVDVGAGTTDVLVFHQGRLKHTAVLPLGGNHVTNDVAAGLQTPFREAEFIKVRHGCALVRLVGDDQMVEVPTVGGRAARVVARRTLANIIEARMEEIFTLARNQLVKSGFDEGLHSGIVLSGGGVQMEGIVALAEQVFKVPVRLGVPLAAEESNGAAATAVNNTWIAAAVGLVQYGARPRDFVPAYTAQGSARGRWVQSVKGWLGGLAPRPQAVWDRLRLRAS